MSLLLEKTTARWRSGRKGLIAYVTAGDPSLESLGTVLPALANGGADVIEIGFPFSDPVADGPVIQQAMVRALDKGVTTEAILANIAAVRTKVSAALVAMISMSILYRKGIEKFVAELKEAGFDGLIVPDAPLEESAELRRVCDANELGLTLLVGPLTPKTRAVEIAGLCSGFVYVLSRSGLTGVQDGGVSQDLPDRLEMLRNNSDRPLAVGFGISTPEQVAEVVATADAAIVGSALVDALYQAESRGQDVARCAHDFVARLASVL